MHGDSNHAAPATTQDTIPLLEWVISGVGLFLVIASLVFLVHKALWVEPMPPDFEARLVGTRPVSQGFEATVEVRNVGGQTAMQLVVIGRLVSDEDPVAREAIIDFLPPRSSRQLKMFFPHQPSDSNTRFEFSSYSLP